MKIDLLGENGTFYSEEIFSNLIFTIEEERYSINHSMKGLTRFSSLTKTFSGAITTSSSIFNLCFSSNDGKIRYSLINRAKHNLISTRKYMNKKKFVKYNKTY